MQVKFTITSLAAPLQIEMEVENGPRYLLRERHHRWRVDCDGLTIDNGGQSYPLTIQEGCSILASYLSEYLAQEYMKRA